MPKDGILAKMPRIQSLAVEMARRGNRGKSNPDFSTVPTALGNPATDAGFPHFPSHDGGGYRLPLKTKPAKIAGPVRFLRRAVF